MNESNVRIKNKVFYIDNSEEDYEQIINKVIRPIVQIKILFFWITIKEFTWYSKHVAESQARKFYNCLTQKNYML